MRGSALLGRIGRSQGDSKAPAEGVSDEFESYAELGSDGIGYIATVNSSPEEAAAITSELQSASDSEWARFVGAASV